MTTTGQDAGARIAIEFISVLDMPPPDLVGVAADLGCRNIGIALAPIMASPACPRWSLRGDAALRDRGVSLSVGGRGSC